MKLSSEAAADFSSQTRARGLDYYRSGSVRIRNGSEWEVKARVRGARQYEVTIAWHGGALSMTCDCPFFDSTGPCKHLWATILAAEAQGYLNQAANRQIREIVYDYAGPEPGGNAPARPSRWREKLNAIEAFSVVSGEHWPVSREILYLIDAASESRGLTLRLMSREPKQAGGWKMPQALRISRHMLPLLPDPRDREILGLISGAQVDFGYGLPGSYAELSDSYHLLHPLAEAVMPLMAATGRCLLQAGAGGEDLPVVWDGGEPWRFSLRWDQRAGGGWLLNGVLRRGQEEMNAAEPVVVTADRILFTRTHAARLDDAGGFVWLRHLRRDGPIAASAAELEQFVAAVLEHPRAPDVELPEPAGIEQIACLPRPRLTIRPPKIHDRQEMLQAELCFEYDGRFAPAHSLSRGIYDAAEHKFRRRDPEAEAAAAVYLERLGVQPPLHGSIPGQTVWRVPPKRLPSVVHGCLEAGWHIEAEGKIFRRPGAMRAEVSSGLDWFELQGEVSYGEVSASLPALLAALRRGETMVRLDDGTYGMLPEQWLRRFGSLAALGDPGRDVVRFGRAQAGLLDALLATQPEIRCDETFARLREQLRTFDGIPPCAQPAGFVGRLRDYQREGLAWMLFLRRFGFGGCLADDMGVGKTAQVLAMLLDRRAEAGGLPSLVVVPRSLVFNWKQEAERFTPQLRLLDYTGAARSIHDFKQCDLVVTTYGTLRRDAVLFADVEFDYAVLDEAQAIKNAATESAKAVRLLRARHRLALSGTPVENHLGELWSLFEFLNPGMLGAASVFKLTGAGARNPDEETRRLLAHALRPFFLRRTKEQVARELPAKSEQTIFCEMDADERRRYDELRAYYRNALLSRIESDGLAKSKIQVLEALLRLRQAACHPGLLDERHRDDSSAKLEVLLTHLIEVTAEGHKALVFSQFTSLLAIVRRRLDEQQIAYEYLDGQTRDRQQRVERFQNDPGCSLFLISLKAGGLGLNLTAAEYIFLLDPWWNPAVEAQAIDRAHRIGQTRPVFAYRLIARDTVEEKVLQLQSSKRDLAAAIISQDNSVIRNLQREDLELLLS